MNNIAGETIKGISVVIGSDTTGLTTALADVNKASRGIQSELKQVEKLLKLDPTNTELLAQKQRLLTDAVANTSEKLNRLRAAQEQVNAQFARGEISAGQYRAFQREIAATEQQLSHYEGQINNTNEAVNNFGDTAQRNAEKLKSAGEKIKGVGEKMSVGITAPIVAAGGLMLKGAVDAENAQSKMQASLGITAEEAQKLGDVATDVWKNAFGESIEEVDEAIITIKKNMAGLADDELKSVTEGAMTIADVFGAEVADSTKAAGTMMKNFGISGQDALDLISVGFQKGGDYSGELLDTLNEYSPQFSAMGISADQMMGILIAGAQAGAFNLDKVGDAMKEFNIRAQDGSKSTAGGFEAIGLSTEQMGAAISKGGDDAQKAFMATVSALATMKDPLQQNAAGTALFGTQWEDVRSKVIIAMADGIKGIGEFKGATDSAAKAMYDNNPGAALTSAMRELQAAIGPALLPLADIIKNTIMPAVKEMVEGFKELSPTGQKVVLAITGIIAALGPLLMIIGPIVSVIGSLIGALGAVSLAMAGGATGIGILTTAFPALGAAIAVITGPIGIAIAVIAALATAAYLIIKNWEPIKKFFGELWASITSSITEAWKGIKKYLVETWESIKSGISSAWDGIKNAIVGAWSAISQGITNAIGVITGVIQTGFVSVRSGVSEIWEGIKNYFIGVWGVIKNIFLGAILLIMDLVTGDFERLSSDAQAIWNNLKEAFGQIWFGIEQAFKGALDAISGVLTLAWNTITNVIKTAWEAVKNYFGTLWDSIKTTAVGAWESFKLTISSITTTLISEIKSTWESILTWFTTLPNRLKQFAVDMFGAMKDGVTTTLPQVVNSIINGIQSAIHWISDLPDKMFDYGTNMIQGLVDGIRSMIDRVRNVVSDVADGIKDKIRSALGINSPSKVMMEIGQYTGLGLAKGMANTVGEVSRQAMFLANAAVPDVNNAGYNGGLNGAAKGNTYSYGSLLNADKIVISNDMDIQELANRLGFYWNQVVTAKGGR